MCRDISYYFWWRLKRSQQNIATENLISCGAYTKLKIKLKLMGRSGSLSKIFCTIHHYLLNFTIMQGIHGRIIYFVERYILYCNTISFQIPITSIIHKTSNSNFICDINRNEIPIPFLLLILALWYERATLGFLLCYVLAQGVLPTSINRISLIYFTEIMNSKQSKERNKFLIATRGDWRVKQVRQLL